MKRTESIQRKHERRKIATLAKQPTPYTIESDAKILTKLLAGKSYDSDDITKCAKLLLTKYGYYFDQQFKLVEDIQKFDEVLEKVELQQQKPLFVIFGKPTKRWVLFCVMSWQDGRNKIFYKDPRGALISFKLEVKLNAKFGNPKLIAQTNQDQETDDEHSYGPLCIRNLEIMLKLLKENPTKFVNEFSQIHFAHPTTVNEEKLKNVIKLTNLLAESDDFKIVLKEFIDKLPLDIGQGMLEYKKVLEEELEKDEEYADLDKIKEARMKCLNQETVNQLQINYKINAKDEEVKEYELEIQKNFPNEMKSLNDILEVLDDVKVDQQLYDAVEIISEILDIDYVKMKSFYELKLKKEDGSQDKKLTPDKIDDISRNLPPPKESSTTDGTPLNQLLSEITLGMDQADASPTQHSKKDIHQLETKYHLVKNKYQQWKNSDIQAINKWAVAIKGRLGVSDDDICKTIATMDRAFNILTGGYRLRDTQILAVLIFFHSQNNRGRLCQIKTGEGKTVIISLIAVIRALQGVTVDVITSNPILAASGVDETRTFYSAFGLTVSTNNPVENDRSDFKIGYTADVLYGTISNFQFDYLKDTFEGFNIRHERRFGQVILDEVDSMLVDNGGHIAKLASPYPGMESLRYIYIKIWQELHKAEQNLIKETEKKVKEFLQNCSDNEEANVDYEKFVQEMILSERKIMKQKIRDTNPTDVPLVPAHLKEYVERKLDLWIKNALHAKYNCHEHQQYRIITNDSGERVVSPVDYLNTGVTLKNTIWSNGLHQFVQLKHNLYLTFESLTSSFISNIGYIKNYEDKNIFGLTGTLGSSAEQELLSHIYNINYAKLPTYKQKKFEEIQGLIADNSSWDRRVATEVLEKIEERRAVLVICETEQDLLTVKRNLEILQNTDFRIRIYANEDNVKETKNKVKIGDIILATNIAGRGTNFKTEKDLEEQGGLHVCVTFLPCNLRVEGQAFGRTSRQGNSGTAQLIIRRSEVDELGIIDDDPDFARIKQERDRLEKERLKQIKEVLVKELNFKDKIFEYFSDFYRNLKQVRATKNFMFILQDLKEFWAFWLEKENFKAATIANTNPKQEFEKFLEKARPIINGTISHNPFYCIGLADHYLEGNSRSKALKVLKHAVEMSGTDNYELLAGLHLKLFELAIMDGEQVMERLKKAMFDVFFIPVSKNEHYKDEALRQLKHAKAAIEKEINYIEQYLTVNENPDFENILLDDNGKNLFLTHINSRLYCLRLHNGNIEQLIKQIETSSGGLDFNGKAPTTLENFDKMSDECQLKVTNSELTELQLIGVDTIYALREIHDIPSVKIYAAVGQISGGIALLCVGLCFLPVFPIMSGFAGMLISEGFMDIVMEVLSNGSSEFDKNDFIKDKFISYGISLITFGIGAVTQAVKILSKAISFCRKLSTFLRKSTYLKGLCNKLANLVDKLGKLFEMRLITVQFNKLTKAEQLDELVKLKQTGSLDKFQQLGGLDKLSELQKLKQTGKLGELARSQLLKNFTKEVIKNTTKKVVKSIVKEKVVKPLLSLALKDIIEKIKDSFQKSVSDSIRSNEHLMQKLRTNSIDTINEVVKGFLEGDEVKKTAKQVGFELLELFKNKVIKALKTGFDTIESIVDLMRCGNQFVSYLDSKLQDGNCKNDVDETVENISSKLADGMFHLLCDSMKGSTEILNLIERHRDSKFKKVGDGKESIVALSSPIKTPVNEAYSILGLESTACLSEIKRKYRRLVLEVHPDKNPNDPYAQQKFQLVHDAYQELVKENNMN
jgi:preprotein translocase subunit SecA